LLPILPKVAIHLYNNQVTNIQNTTMLTPQELIERFGKVKEKGDINKLTKVLGFKDHSTTSLVVSGQQHTTVSKIAKLKKFIEKREKEIIQLTEND
jgi:hypothetical protein